MVEWSKDQYVNPNSQTTLGKTQDVILLPLIQRCLKLKEFSAFFQYFDTAGFQIGKTSCIKKENKLFFFFGRNIGKLD